MVDLSISIAAVKEVLCEDTALVRSEHTVRIDASGERLHLEQLSQLFVVAAIVLDITDVLHVHSFVCSIFAAVALFFAHAVLEIVFFFENAKFGDVGESLIHPTTSASIVVIVAIKQLLNRVFLDFLVNAGDLGQTLDS